MREYKENLRHFEGRLRSLGQIDCHDYNWRNIFEGYHLKWNKRWDKFCDGHYYVNSHYYISSKNSLYSSYTIFNRKGQELLFKWILHGDEKDIKPFFKWFSEKMDEQLKESLIEKKEEIINEKKEKEGLVYIIESEGFYKIGRTKDIKARCRQYMVENPHPMKILFSIKVKDCFETEKKLLELYKSKRHRGEWFKLSKTDTKIIKNYLINQI